MLGIWRICSPALGLLTEPTHLSPAFGKELSEIKLSPGQPVCRPDSHLVHPSPKVFGYVHRLLEVAVVVVEGTHAACFSDQ